MSESSLPFGIKRLSGRDLPPINPSHEYQAILAGDPRMITWYTLHSKVLPELSTRPDFQARTTNLIHAHLRSSENLKKEVPLPEVQWVSDDDVITNITGGPFAIPVMVFPRELTPVYNAITNNSGGMTTTLPIEYVTLGEVNSAQAIDSQLVLLPHPSIPFTIPARERKNHELAHALDPYVDLRETDNILMRELVAIIGSFSDSNNRLTSLTLHPPFIINYVIQTMQMEGKELNADEIRKMANLIISLVYNMTHIYPKIPNDQITRRIMKCRSLAELKTDWPDVFPKNDQDDDLVIIIDPE